MADSTLSRLVAALFGEAQAASYPTQPQPVAGSIMQQQLDPSTRYLYNTEMVAPTSSTTTTTTPPPTLPAAAPGLDQGSVARALGDRGNLSVGQAAPLRDLIPNKPPTKAQMKAWRGQKRDLDSLLRHGNDPAMAETVLQSLLDSGAIYEESPGEVGGYGPRGGKNANRRFLEYLLDFSRRTGQVPMPKPQ